MVNVCCVDGCIQTKDVIYFNVPNSRTLRKRWLEAFKPNCKLTNHSVVCSKHFLPGQYETVRGKKRLKAKVVPSVFDEINKQETPKESPHKEIIKETKTTERDRDRRKSAKEHKKKKRRDSSKNNTEDSIVKSTAPEVATDCEAHKDIEEIITNYHIQVPNRNKETEPHENVNLEKNGEYGEGGEIEDLITNFHIKQTKPVNEEAQVQDSGEVKEGGESVENDPNIIDVDNLKDPVFIEVSVDKEERNNKDCVMLLESVQCEVDPTSLMLEDPDPGPDPAPEDEDDDVVDLGEKKEDPISLLTSSDEDDVILEEPKIDTVEVSDETDEDDMPLVKLVENPTKTKTKTRKKSKRRTKDGMAKFMWGMFEYYCVECHYRTTNKSDFMEHSLEHPTVLQICQICGYTTASKAQFVRHRRKHVDDKKFKCHLCEYKARHNMSLIYHLKTHDCVKLVNAKKGFKCEKCGFISDVKVELLKHVRLCTSGDRKYVCDRCNYESKRKSDLKRHKMRRHKKLGDDEDYVPP